MVYCWNMPKFSMEILSEQSICQVHGIRFLLHHHIGKNLRGVDAGMPKKLARRIDVCPGCQGHCGKGVAAGVESDEFVDSGTFRHGLQGPVGSTQFRSVGENQLVACILRPLRPLWHTAQHRPAPCPRHQLHRPALHGLLRRPLPHAHPLQAHPLSQCPQHPPPVGRLHHPPHHHLLPLLPPRASRGEGAMAQRTIQEKSCNPLPAVASHPAL